MPELYGKTLSRLDLARMSGDARAFGGVRLMTLGDGLERGIRLLEFRAGRMRFTVAVDRAMDILELEWQGVPLHWSGPSGLRNAALHEYEGEGGFSWGRSFTGLMVTCGLDHVGGPAEVPAGNYNYPGVRTVRHGLHGRVSTIPARLTGYGERWDGERCILWAEGEIRQAATFGETLTLLRRIECDLGGQEIRLTDRVVNTGFLAVPHMFFYHVNLGAPLLAEGARYLAPITESLWASHEGRYRDQGVGYRTMPGPQPRFAEQVWQHATTGAEVPVALVNDALGLGLMLTTRRDQLPCLYQWQHFQEGGYALGIEPATHHILGDLAARERGEMIWLGPQEGRSYDARFAVVTDLAAAEARIRSIHGQPDTDYPEITGRFPSLRPMG